MSDARKVLVLRALLACGVLLALFWSSANTGWMNVVLNWPGAAFVFSGTTLVWMLVSALGGIALTDRKNFVYLLGLVALIPAVSILMVQPFIS